MLKYKSTLYSPTETRRHRSEFNFCYTNVFVVPHFSWLFALFHINKPFLCDFSLSKICQWDGVTKAVIKDITLIEEYMIQ